MSDTIQTIATVSPESIEVADRTLHANLSDASVAKGTYGSFTRWKFHDPNDFEGVIIGTEENPYFLISATPEQLSSELLKQYQTFNEANFDKLSNAHPIYREYLRSLLDLSRGEGLEEFRRYNLTHEAVHRMQEQKLGSATVEHRLSAVRDAARKTEENNDLVDQIQKTLFDLRYAQEMQAHVEAFCSSIRNDAPDYIWEALLTYFTISTIIVNISKEHDYEKQEVRDTLYCFSTLALLSGDLEAADKINDGNLLDYIGDAFHDVTSNKDLLRKRFTDTKFRKKVDAKHTKAVEAAKLLFEKLQTNSADTPDTLAPDTLTSLTPDEH